MATFTLYDCRKILLKVVTVLGNGSINGRTTKSKLIKSGSMMHARTSVQALIMHEIAGSINNQVLTLDIALREKRRE